MESYDDPEVASAADAPEVGDSAAEAASAASRTANERVAHSSSVSHCESYQVLDRSNQSAARHPPPSESSALRQERLLRPRLLRPLPRHKRE